MFFVSHGDGHLGHAGSTAKNRASLAADPVNSCFYCLIFKRTFLRLKKDLSFNFGGWAPVLEQINDLSP